MNVFINNEKREIEKQKTLIDLLKDIQMDNARGIAVAVNNEVVPKMTWAKHILEENNRITIIKATQGG